ncbi:MAG: S8 family serine peptidase, partial [Candidatus Thermoplasmatota archaeon]
MFSGSWGGTSSAYTTEARMTDTFVWNNPDAFIVFANGNNPPAPTTGSPATNKNGIAVSGATGVTSREAVSSGASRGPTTDGRRKPDTTTFYWTTSPGGTAASDGDPLSLNSGDTSFGGTSYSTPLAAGMAALARQYFMTGWYPRGQSGGLAMLPSAALLKAVLTAGSVQMTGAGSCPASDAFYPNIAQGWGRLWLNESLYFAGDAKKLFVVDHPSGLFTGDTVEYKVRLASGTGRLRVMLAWSDYPAIEGASPALVNNLDLEVIDPSGTSYKGNVRGPCSQGQSAIGGTFDALNNLEGVVRVQPATGDWRIRVIGANVPYGTQKYGLVVLADLDRTYGIVEVDKTRYGEADTIAIRVTDSDATAVSVQVTTPTEPAGETVVLTSVPAGSQIWRGNLPTRYAVPTTNGSIEGSHLDTITVTYSDLNPPHASIATARAEVDGAAIWDVRVTGITNAGATITWKTDKPANSAVNYGTTTGLGTVVSNPVMVTTHSLTITGLTTETLYYFDVASAYTGHTTTDSNGGRHYRFKTVEKAEILLVLSDLGSLTQERLEMYRSALAGASWASNEWDIGRQGDPPLATLQEYKVILWQAGLEQYPPMADAHATLLKSYVDNGGRIFFSGHDYAWA